jgi:hypothetical protein
VPGHDAHLYGWTHQATQIVVLNLATGHCSTYTSRQGQHYRWLFIANLSWTNGGRDLAYLGRWCDQSIDGFNAACAWSGRSELRLIELSQGKFRGGPVILRPSQRYPVILQALITVDGRSVVAMTTTRHGDLLSVVRLSARTGKPIEVLYRGRKVHQLLEAFLSADGFGRYFILDQDHGIVSGWVHNGVLHPMRLGQVLLSQAPVW